MVAVAGFDEVKAALRQRSRSFLEELLPGGVWSGNEYAPRNPKRSDARPGGPFSINAETGAWFDSVAGEKGGDLISLFAYLRDLKPGQACNELAHQLGLNGSHGARAYLNGGGPTNGSKRANDRRDARARRNLGDLVATNDYKDKDGQLRYQVLRYERVDEKGERKKTFLQRRPCPSCKGQDRGGCGDTECKRGWIWNLHGVEPVPYGLADIMKSEPRPSSGKLKGIAIPEGEKCVDALKRINVLSACNSGGAGHWQPELNPYFDGRPVAIFADNDQAGERDVLIKARNLDGHATEIKIVYARDLGLTKPKADVADWVEAKEREGKPSEEIKLELLVIIEKTPAWEKSAAATSPTAADGSHDRGGQATQLVNLALERCVELFHDGEDAYVTVPVDSHRETHRIDSRAFRRLLSRWYFENRATAPNSESVSAARNVLEANALFEGAERAVYLRVANVDAKIYVDIGDEGWQVIEVTRDKWRVIESKDAPVRFRRTKGMEPFPTPERGGDIRQLRGFLNLASDADFMLVVAFIVMALRGRGPYPVLLLRAGQGGAKSTQLRVVRRFIDPNSLPLRTWPKEPRDFAIAAENSLALCFDNASSIPQWLSDLICMAATGGGFAVRTHYENREEELFSFMRPVAITAIRMIIVSPDLEDRAVILDLPRIADEKRRDEEGFWADFDQAYPELFGVILDGLSTALRNVDAVELKRCPRLADFAVWSCAAMPAFEWTKDDFMSAYTANREDANAATLESNLIAPFVEDLAPMAPAEPWKGTATELLQLINNKSDEPARKKKGWPADARSLSNALRKIATNLAKVGIEVDFKRDKQKRWIEIHKVPKEFF